MQSYITVKLFTELMKISPIFLAGECVERLGWCIEGKVAKLTSWHSLLMFKALLIKVCLEVEDCESSLRLAAS